MKKTICILAFLHLLYVSTIAQTQNTGIADEIYQRAETYYNDSQYAQAADLLDRLSVLKIPADFRSAHLKVKALSFLYAKDAKYSSLMESSLPVFFELANGPSAPAQKIREIELIKARFEQYRASEKLALDKAKTGTVQDKQEYVRNYPGSPEAEELRTSIAEESVYDKSMNIKKLEMQLWDLNRQRKRKKRAIGWGVTAATVGLCSVIWGIVGLAEYDPDEYYSDNLMSKNTAWAFIGAGAGPAVGGWLISIPASYKKERIEKKIKSVEQDIVNAKKTVVHLSPYSKLGTGGSFGLRCAMQF